MLYCNWVHLIQFSLLIYNKARDRGRIAINNGEKCIALANHNHDRWPLNLIASDIFGSEVCLKGCPFIISKIISMPFQHLKLVVKSIGSYTTKSNTSFSTEETEKIYLSINQYQQFEICFYSHVFNLMS